ncbi:hypothetical protein AB6803_31340 [Rhizobium sp. RCC_161_2]
MPQVPSSTTKRVFTLVYFVIGFVMEQQDLLRGTEPAGQDENTLAAKYPFAACDA